MVLAMGSKAKKPGGGEGSKEEILVKAVLSCMVCVSEPLCSCSDRGRVVLAMVVRHATKADTGVRSVCGKNPRIAVFVCVV